MTFAVATVVGWEVGGRRWWNVDHK